MTDEMDYRTAPGASLLPEEREWLRDVSATVAERFSAPVIVHIGVGPGGSLWCSRAGAPEARLIGIDVDPGQMVGDAQAELVQADSRIAHRWFEDPIHFLFVDGDHEEGSVLADIVGWSPKVVDGGMIAFHDYGNSFLRWCRGVKAAVDAWFQDRPEWEQIEAAGSIRAFVRRIDENVD